ncbi:MAG TPA: NUDIX domain-containing protein [Candidatus Eisenbacteria bacterium]|nr:NUDIX domain-containing protein [Candidatus Eisenbacteria bacterium]
MPRTSAGILLFRGSGPELEVLLVHPGGPFWAKKDLWGIPKGEIHLGEDPLEAARREFEEETGFAVDGQFLPLGEVRQKSGKIVRAWAVRGDLDADAIRSNEFEVEWPPGSGRKRSYPEIDRGAWYGLDEAARRIRPEQRPLLDALVATLRR